jgi:hypothetical protein
VKQGGAHWLVQERKGRRVFSRGVCAPLERIERVRVDLERERATPEYARRLEASRARRERQQEEYVEDFRAAVLGFLEFAPRYAALAQELADEVTAHTTPVGGGTVARTRRIPLADRAASAVIAWLRHNTTKYDQLEIARTRGRRREVRRRLARRSKQLLAQFRRGDAVDPAGCPLRQALPGPAARPARPAPHKRVAVTLWRSGLYEPS